MTFLKEFVIVRLYIEPGFALGVAKAFCKICFIDVTAFRFRPWGMRVAWEEIRV